MYIYVLLVYETDDFIHNLLVKLLRHAKNELQNERFLPTVGLEPNTFRLLDWRSI